MTPTIHEAQKLARQADVLLTLGDLGRALQKLEDAAMVVCAVLRGDSDAAAEVRRVMRHGEDE